MQYGLYLAASGMMTGMHRMDVHANNLANVETVGFKLDVASPRQRDPARIEQRGSGVSANKMLEQLGGGVLMSQSRISFRQATLEVTGNPLDVALQGTGFMVVRDGSGSSSDTLRFTRDGRLTLNKEGTLVQASSGKPVLDTRDRPISLVADLPVEIDADGNVRQGGNLVTQIQLANVRDPSALRKRGDNLFSADASTMAAKQPVTTAMFNQGAVERSGVDPVKTIMDVGRAERAVSGGARMISTYDELIGKAINTFGKVS